MALSHGPLIVANGLVLCLDAADRNSYPGSGTTWTDLSGKGTIGTLTNGPTYSSANGGSIVFDGTNDFVSLPNLGMPSSGARTFEVWIKANSVTSIRTLCGYGNIGTYLQSNLLHINAVSSGDIYWGFNNADFYTTGNTINTTQYYNICAIYNGGPLTTSNIVIYVNAVSQTITATATGGIGSTPNTTDTSYSIGGDNNVRAYSGNIPIVKLYNRALTASEVQQNFNALRGRFGI